MELSKIIQAMIFNKSSCVTWFMDGALKTSSNIQKFTFKVKSNF